MEDDLSTIAENKLDALIQAEENGDGKTPPNPPADDEQDDDKSKPNQEEGKDNDGQPENGEEDDSKQKDGDEEQEEEDEQGKKVNDDDDGEKGKKTQELSDEDFLAELERRGLKVADKSKEDSKPNQQQPQSLPRPSEIPEDVWGGMHPIQQYIYKELPVISVRGKDGNTVSIKTPDQLPEDFEFASARDEAKFNSDVASQSLRAEKMYDNINNYRDQQVNQEKSQQESKTIVEDVDKLQKDGIIPKIEAKPGTPEFNTDPGVIRANQILAYREDLKSKGEVISAYSAGLQFKALHPDLYKEAPSKSPGDEERKNKSKNISSKGKGKPQASTNKNRRVYPIGMSAADIADIASEDLD